LVLLHRKNRHDHKNLKQRKDFGREINFHSKIKFFSVLLDLIARTSDLFIRPQFGNVSLINF